MEDRKVTLLKVCLELLQNQEKMDKLMSELNWLAQTYDYQIETLLDIREKILEQYK